jgi:hypothetical protein
MDNEELRVLLLLQQLVDFFGRQLNNNQLLLP